MEAARQGRHPVHESLPPGAKALTEVVADQRERSRHAKSDCHAVVVRRVSWGPGYDEFGVCTEFPRKWPCR